MPIEQTENEFRARIKSPNAFVRIRQIWPSRRTAGAHYPYNSKGIRALGGPLKSDPRKVEVQALRFSKKSRYGWTVAKIRKWLKDHGYKVKEVEMEDNIEGTFKALVPIHKSYEQNGKKYIEVIIIGVSEDRMEDRMAESAVEGMIKQIKAGGVALFDLHGRGANWPNVRYDWRDILAKAEDAWQEDDNLIAKFRINEINETALLLWRYIHEMKLPVGFSIGGIIRKKHEEVIEAGVDAVDSNDTAPSQTLDKSDIDPVSLEMSREDVKEELLQKKLELMKSIWDGKEKKAEEELIKKKLELIEKLTKRLEE